MLLVIMSIVIQFDPWARMGNRMFQYAFGYILAKRKLSPLYHLEGLPNFNIKPSSGDINWALANKPILYTKQFGNNFVDIDQVLQHNGTTVVNSFVQLSQYYTPYKNDLKEVFNITYDQSLINSQNQINDNSLVVHIRETDYVQIDGFLGYTFYKNLIDTSNFTDVIIVTDNSKCETVQKLILDGCKLHTEGYVDKFETTSDSRSMRDFKFLLNSSNIAISQSSFSWWAAFLGSHKKIIFPYKTNKGVWPINPKQDDIDLYFEHQGNEKFIL